MIVTAWFIGFVIVFQLKVIPTNKTTTNTVDTTTNNNNNNNNNPSVVFDENANYDSPLLIFTCQRARYLQETLEYIYESMMHFDSTKPCTFGCPIIISEDGRHHDEIQQVISEYRNKFEMSSKKVPIIHMIHNIQDQYNNNNNNRNHHHTIYEPKKIPTKDIRN